MHNRLMLNIACASETGTAIDLVREFIDDCVHHNIKIASVGSLGSHTNLTPGIWVMFVATTGQGQPPHATRPFWKNIMKKSFELGGKVRFSVYALGDRSYGDDFCMAGRKLRQRLKMLGAEEFREIGLGDEQEPLGSRHQYLRNWRDDVLKYLIENAEKGSSQGVKLSLRIPLKQFEFKVASIEMLTERKGREVYWLEACLPQTIKASEGQVLEIYPHNRPQDVAFLLEYLDQNPNSIVEYNGLPITVLQLLSTRLNISSVLNYYFFINKDRHLLKKWAASDLYRQKLDQFAKDYSEYHHFIKQYKRSLIDFLRDFNIKITLQYLMNTLNEVIGRKYSIARVEGQRIWMMVKLIDTDIVANRRHRGVCSHDLISGASLIRKGRLLESDIRPADIRENNLIVTLGTGIAPFIWMLDQLPSKQQPFLLIYSNSYHDEIYHHHKSINQTQKVSPDKEILSITREGGKRMIRLLEEQAERIVDFLAQKGLKQTRIFYCGPKQVYDYLLTFIAKLVGATESDVKKSKLIVYQNW